MAAAHKPLLIKVNVRILHVFFSGPPSMAAINDTTGVRGYCRWKIENKEEYMRAVLLPFQDRGGIARSVERGSIVVTVAAENTQVANRIIDDCVAGRIMKEVNDLLDEFDEKHAEEKVGNFEKIGVIAEEASQVSIEKWIDTKIEYERNIKKIIEVGLKPYEDVTNQILIRSRYVESRTRFDENRSKFDQSRSVFEINRSVPEGYVSSSEEYRMKYEANRRQFEHNRKYRWEQARRITAEESRMRYDDRQRAKKATSSGQNVSY